MSKVLYETSNLAQLFVRFRLDDMSTASEPSTLVAAWSPLEVLLLDPEYAMLSHESVGFLRLPAPLARIREEMLKYCQGGPANLELQVLCTPLGQLTWALHELERCLPRGTRELEKRFHKLCLHASRNWPAWFDGVIADIEDEFSARGSIPQLLQALRRRAEFAATFEACRPLLTWMEDTNLHDRISMLHESLCYGVQGLIDLQGTLDLAADPWWQFLAKDLATSLASLATVTLGGANTNAIVGNQLAQISLAIKEMERRSQNPAKWQKEEIACAYAAVDTLAGSLHDIFYLRRSILSETFSAAE